METTTAIEATVLVSQEIAEGLPSHPEWVRECMTAAEDGMAPVAAERHRHLSEPPRLVETRDTALGFVELRFEAETAAD